MTSLVQTRIYRQKWAIEPLTLDNNDLFEKNWGARSYITIPVDAIAKIKDNTQLRAFVAIRDLMGPHEHLSDAVTWKGISKAAGLPVKSMKKAVRGLIKEHGLRRKPVAVNTGKLTFDTEYMEFDWNHFISIPYRISFFLQWLTHFEFRLFLTMKYVVGGNLRRHVSMWILSQVSGMCRTSILTCAKTISTKVNKISHMMYENVRWEVLGKASYTWHSVDLSGISAWVKLRSDMTPILATHFGRTAIPIPLRDPPFGADIWDPGPTFRGSGDDIQSDRQGIRGRHSIGSAGDPGTISPTRSTTCRDNVLPIRIRFRSGSGVPVRSSAASPVETAGDGISPFGATDRGEAMIQRKGMIGDVPIISAIPRAEPANPPDIDHPSVSQVPKASYALRRECFQTWVSRCRNMWEMSSGKPAAEAQTIWGARGYDLARPEVDIIDELIHSCYAIALDPVFLFGMAPYFLRGEDHQRLTAIGTVLPLAQQLAEENQDQPDNLKKILGWFDEACASIPKGGGNTSKIPKTHEEILNICATLFAVMPLATDKWGSLDDFFKAKITNKNKFIADMAAKGQHVANISIWDLLGPNWEPRNNSGPRKQDEWTEIRAFLGLSDDVRISEGWIPAGFRLNRQHEAMAMNTSARRQNPLVGTMADIKLISKSIYITRSGEQFFSDCHYIETKPERCLIIKVTPENFHEFKDQWNARLFSSAPDFDEYLRYGLYIDYIDRESQSIKIGNKEYHPNWRKK